MNGMLGMLTWWVCGTRSERGKGKGKAPSEIEYRFKAEIPLKGATVSASPSTPRERGITQSFSISSFSPRSSVSSKEKVITHSLIFGSSLA